ncbi:MAG: hypothetical protein HC889_17105 [Synechococcaceae cyanobacterium SM1_2_3]|nr:hypothetical protein [Synechococcaceae cyanobacterium SM1_2_3]
MKLGPIDFTQFSTWRGAAGFLAIFGIAVSPELTNAICLALGAVLSAIEIARDEYAHRNAAQPLNLSPDDPPPGATALSIAVAQRLRMEKRAAQADRDLEDHARRREPKPELESASGFENR